MKLFYFLPILLVVSFSLITEAPEGFASENFKNAKIVFTGIILGYDEINDELYYDFQILEIEKSPSTIPELIKVRSVTPESYEPRDEIPVWGINHVVRLHFFESDTEREYWQASNISEVITRFCSNSEHVVVKMTRVDKPLICVTLSTAERLLERNILVDKFGFAEPLLEMPEPPMDIKPDLPNDQKPIDASSNPSQNQNMSTISEIISGNNEFSFEFYHLVSEGKDNVFFSPLSISTAFAVVYEGTKGKTTQEIGDTFGFPKEDSQRRSSFNHILNNLTESGSDSTLKIANALWLAQGFQPLSDFVDTSKTYYDSKISNVNFKTDEGVNIINQWVREKTENKIEKLIEPGSTNELTRLILTNAIYFNGTWVKSFEEKATRDAEFKISLENSVLVPMMWLRETKFNYTENENTQILEMPYQGNKISMIILLPKKVDGIQSLEDSLTMENFLKWKENFSQRSMEVYLPKFTFETSYNLKDDLQKMGINEAFDQNKADFSGLTPEKLFIEFAIHKAFVEVNEMGTEAAAVTGIGISATSEETDPPVFNADHPFIFIIQDNETGNILFMGRVMNPLE